MYQTCVWAWGNCVKTTPAAITAVLVPINFSVPMDTTALQKICVRIVLRPQTTARAARVTIVLPARRFIRVTIVRRVHRVIAVFPITK